MTLPARAGRCRGAGGLLAACNKDKTCRAAGRARGHQARRSPCSSSGPRASAAAARSCASRSASPRTDGTVFAAARDGRCARSMRPPAGPAGRRRPRLDLSAGPARASGLVVVGTNGGQLIALDAATGKQRWTCQMSGEVLAAPLVAGDRVVVRLVDGRLRGAAVRPTARKSGWPRTGAAAVAARHVAAGAVPATT